MVTVLVSRELASACGSVYDEGEVGNIPESIRDFVSRLYHGNDETDYFDWYEYMEGSMQ